MNERTALIVVPDHAWPEGGNAVTAKRIVAGLGRERVRAEAIPFRQLEERATGEDVGLLHALHARRSGVPVAALARRLGVPFVVTITGTDLYDDLTPPAGKPDMRDVLEGSAAVTVFHGKAAEIAARSVPFLIPKLHVVPPAVQAMAGRRDRASFGIPEESFVFLLPAGLRPVKDPLFALGPLERLREEGHHLLFVIAGPPLDAQVAAAVRQAVGGRAWVRWLGAVPHESMGSLLRSSDVVLNTSTAEGLSNAVLEAMAARRPILARRNDGNLAALGRDGLFFDDPDGLLEAARRLIGDPLLRQRVADEALARSLREFDPAVEAAGYARIYGGVLGVRKTACCGSKA